MSTDAFSPQLFQVREKGIYAPLTSSGSVVVNNVLASCYSNSMAEPIHQTIFRALQMLANAMSFLTNSIVSNQEVPFGVSILSDTLTDVFPSSVL